MQLKSLRHNTVSKTRSSIKSNMLQIPWKIIIPLIYLFTFVIYCLTHLENSKVCTFKNFIIDYVVWNFNKQIVKYQL